MTFNKMVQLAESGQEITCQSFAAGYTAIWYEHNDVQYQVRYDSATRKAESVQIVGTQDVLHSD
jgi:hypothetical protein